MKIILIFILSCFSYFIGSSQPVIQRSTATNTVRDARWMGQFNMFVPRYNDTTAANLQKGIDSCGAMIFTYDYNGYWFRACNPKRWLQIIPSGNPTKDTLYWKIGGNNLSTLASDRPHLGSTDSSEVNFITNNQIRIVIPPNGIIRNSNANLKNIKYDTTTKLLYYYDDGGSGGGGGIDSLRRIGVNVSALKNGVWTNQFTDSVGSGGGSQNLDQTLAIGNNTDTTINFVDTLSANEGKQFVTIYPKGYGQTGYPNGRPAMFSGLGYQRYPGVNADGRPNVVGLLWGYNGGFNTPTIANEATWGVRTETWYQIGGFGHSEFHGVMPEFKAINGSARRLATAYVNNLTGYTNYNLGIDNMNVMRGASDTPQLASSLNRLLAGFKGVGDITLKNQDSATNTAQIVLALNGTLFNNSVSAGAQPLNSFGFNSVVNVQPGTSYGSSSTYTGLVNTTVAVANKYGFSTVSSGLTTQNWGGISLDGNTTGTITSLYTRQLGANGTVETWLAAANGSTAQYAMTDVGNGIKWRWYLKSGDTDREMAIGFGTSSFDSLMKFRGTDGKVQIRTNLNVGSTAYAPASAALSVTSTTQGFLPPVMTSVQRLAIVSPAEGLIVVQSDGTKGLYMYINGVWRTFVML